MTSESLISQLKWNGYGIHESFKNPNSPSQWYSACVSVCKAAEHALKAESWPKLEGVEKVIDVFSNPPYLVFVKPIVILDGILLAADLSEQGEIDIAEIEMAPMKFHFKSRSYTRSSYRIDIIGLNGLEKYIELSNKRHDRIHRGLLKHSGIEA